MNTNCKVSLSGILLFISMQLSVAQKSSSDKDIEVISVNGIWKLKDKNTNEVIKGDLKYDEIDAFVHGAARIRVEKKWGFINSQGKEIVSPKYDFVYDFDEDMADVMFNGKYGFIDKTGKEVIELKYSSAHNFKEGLAAVAINDKWGYVNKTGKEVVPLKYENIHDFEGGIAEVMNKDKHGLINRSGKEITPIKYDAVYKQKNTNLIIVKLDDKFGIADTSNKKVLSLKYSDINDGISEGLVMVEYKSKKGFINKEGKEIIPAIYDEAQPFVGGKSEVLLNDETFSIDNNGKRILKPLNLSEPAGKPIYDKFVLYDGDLNFSYRKGKMGLGHLLEDGKFDEVLPAEFDKIESVLGGDFWKVQAGKKFGMYYQDGRKSLDCIYDEIKLNGWDGGYLVKKDNKWGVMGYEGNVIYEIKYNSVEDIKKESAEH